MDLALYKSKALIGKGKSVDLADDSITTVMTIPYNTVMEIERIEINNKHTEDTQFDIYNTFSDTDAVARTELIGSYKVVAGLTIGIDVSRSKKAFGVIKAQMDAATPTTDPTVYVGGTLV